MYEAMDLFHRHVEEVEKSVFHRVADLFNMEVDIVFYDTTTASFSIDDADEDGEDGEGLRKLGHSKEGTWTAQVVVALAVTRDGLPVRSWVFPGNTSDVTTIGKIKKDLRGWKLGRALFVADAGMNSEGARKELTKACGKYLMAARMGSVKEIKEEVLSTRGRYKVISDNLHAKEVVVGDGVRRRRYILCYNPHQAKRERLHREQVLAELKEKLAGHPDKKATAQWAIVLKASGRYGRYLATTKGGKLRINRAAVKEAERRDGKWVIQTNDDTVTPEDAASGYKALLVIERCFRSLKRTQIKMMPMYHWAPRRIETHVKICVLALLIERIAERACQKSWGRIRDDLVTLQATKFSNKSFYFFERNQPSKEASEILKKLDIPLPKRILAITPE
jgi:transposase